MKLIFAFILILNAVSSFTQDLNHSFGPAPEKDITQQQNPMSYAVGSRAWTMHTGFQLGKSFMESCVITPVGPVLPITFPGGLLYVEGKVYTWNQSSPYQFYEVDTVTGAYTLLGNIAGVTLTNLTGMAYDGTTIYALQSNLSQSQVAQFNINTRVLTGIGTPSAVCAGGITLLCRQGQFNLFVLDIVADNIYKVHKATGVFTLVGPLGFNANFGQDGSVDWRDNAFYLACYNATSGAAELRKLDTATGSSVLLCTYAVTQMTGLAVNNNIVSLSNPLTICRNNVNRTIPNMTTVMDTIRISAPFSYIVRDLIVTIDTLVHSWDSDLRLYIKHGSTGTRFINNVGGSGDNFIRTNIKDSLVYCQIGSTGCNTPPFTGTFRPSVGGSFANFVGLPLNGDWILSITDTATADTGTLKAWCITIRWYDFFEGISGEPSIIPDKHLLSQNYPNPFNPTTIIKYGLPKAENVKLTVYDILGSEVAVLVNEYKQAGIYNIGFDGSTLASGVYFYKLVAGDYTETKKMLLIK